VILLAGARRNDDDPDPEASAVETRLLDATPWAVTDYDFEAGDFVLTRGVNPTGSGQHEDSDYVAHEGESRRSFVLHRRREAALRKKKLLASLIENDGVLRCAVPGCGFDFKARYGKLGEGYADAPSEGTKTSLKDLAVVCANCHAMIHVGGECRPLGGLIQSGSAM
jgi:5-methylcytosine-specific restriction protein A